MAIRITDTVLNKDYIHQGKHRITLSFKGESVRHGDEVNLVLRSKHPDLVCFLDQGKEMNEIRFQTKFNSSMQLFEQEIMLKQVSTPEKPTYAGFLISGKNRNGNTASEEFVLQCK